MGRLFPDLIQVERVTVGGYGAGYPAGGRESGVAVRMNRTGGYASAGSAGGSGWPPRPGRPGSIGGGGRLCTGFGRPAGCCCRCCCPVRLATTAQDYNGWRNKRMDSF